MFPLLGGLLAGGIGALSSSMNTQANNQNAQQMQQQAEQYNTQMSNTAYQRASADMTAAGLNPAMMFGSGSAASSPTIQPAQKSSAAGGIGSAVQSVVPTAVALKTADATIDNLVSQNAKIKAETLTEGEKPNLVFQEAASKNKDVALKSAETDRVKAQLPLLLDEGVSARNRMDMNSTVRKGLDQAGFAGNAVNNAIKPAANLVSSARGVHSMWNYDNRWP